MADGIRDAVNFAHRVAEERKSSNERLEAEKQLMQITLTQILGLMHSVRTEIDILANLEPMPVSDWQLINGYANGIENAVRFLKISK